jgi:anion-transporting  ArsA/GET3 family ATPase
MLGKAWWHTTERNVDGSWRFDVVILDAPATGHGLDMLRVPKVIVEVVPPGLLRRDAERAWAMFQDATISGVILVTLPEEMPTTETIELAKALRGDLHLPLDRVVVNGVLPRLFSPAERAVLAGLGARGEGPNERGASENRPSDAVLGAGWMRASQEAMQAESLARLSNELALTPVQLPLLFEDAATPEGIRELARRV